MPPSHPPPASLNTMRVESILFHAATRSRNVKNIPNAIPLKRNEFRIDGRLIIGYGGSESLQAPKGEFGRVAKRLIKDLGIDINRFEIAFERKFYPSFGLSRAVFCSRETFGRDVLVTGDPMSVVPDDLMPELLNARSARDFVADFPISDKGKSEMLGLYEQKNRSARRQNRRAEDQDVADHQLS